MRLHSLILTALFFILVCLPSRAAWLFDGTSDYVEGPDISTLHLPDGDWTISVSVQITDNSGANNAFIFNTLSNDFPHSGFLDMYVSQDSHATTSIRGDVAVDINDDKITLSPDGYIETKGTPPFAGNTEWTSLILERSGNTVTLYVNNVANGTYSNSELDEITPTGIFWGARFDLASDRFFRGAQAEFGIWARGLTEEERSALSLYAPVCLPNGLQEYVPMKNEYVARKSGAPLANNGTTISQHPRIIYCAD